MDDSFTDAVTQRLNALTLVVKQTKTDSQKFAALLAVSKMLKAEELTSSQRKDVFEAIGFSFLIRLLTSNGDSECPKSVFNELGLSILVSFVSDPELVQAPEHKKIIPEVLKIVEERSQDQNQVLYDCFCYFASIASVDYNCLNILKQNGIKRLVHAFCRDIEEQMRPVFWSCLHQLIRFDPEIVWFRNRESMMHLLNFLTENACSNFSEKKFDLFEHLSYLLTTLSPEHVEFYRNKTWIKDLRKSLFQVVGSRVTSKERNPTLRLCQHLTDVFGLSWIKSDEKISENERKFPVLLTKLSCVEIQVFIHNRLSTKDCLVQVLDSEETLIFVACCALFEASCSAIADYDINETKDEIFTYEDVEQLEGSLAETVEGLALTLLPKLIGHAELVNLVLGCLRTIGSWLNVQIFATSKVGLSVIDPIFATFKFCLEFDPAAVIKSLTPAFLNYSETENAKNQLLNYGILSCLSTNLVEKEMPSESSCLCAQSLMAFVVESPNLEEFDNILPALMNYSLTLEHSETLCFYVVLLTLMVWNKQFNSSRQHPQRERFFQNIIKLLHSLHVINGSVAKISKR